MSSDPLISLTYTSRAKLDLAAHELVAIHHTARHCNALDGITGLLIFNGVTFLQTIEGAEDAIASLLERLRHDPRHSSLEVRDRRRVEERQFPDWSMELIRVDTDWHTARADIEKALPDTIDPDIRALILRMDASGEQVRLPD